MVVKISVTPEQVRAAQLEVRAMRSAGLTPDPLVERLAQTQVFEEAEAPVARAAGREEAAQTVQDMQEAALHSSTGRLPLHEVSDPADLPEPLERLLGRRQLVQLLLEQEHREALRERKYVELHQRDQLTRRRLQTYLIALATFFYVSASVALLVVAKQAWPSWVAFTVGVFAALSTAVGLRGLGFPRSKADEQHWSGIAAVGQPISTSGESRVNADAGSSVSQQSKKR